MVDGAVIRLSWASVAEAGDRIGQLLAALPNDERRRAGRFRVDAARGCFVVGRTVLRRVLARALEVDPSDLVFDLGPHGRPALVDPRPPAGLDFNLSHSGDLVVAVVAPTPVGVDVEALRRITLAERLARRFFGPAERDAVLGAATSARDRTFLRIWTQKEAWLKATGIGIGMALRAVEVEPDPDRPPRLAAVDGSADEARGWTLVEADIPGAVCTVAVRGGPPEIAVRRVDPAAAADGLMPV